MAGDDEEEHNEGDDMMSRLAAAGAARVADSAAGWITDTIFGGGGSGDIQKLQQQIQEQQRMIAALGTQIANLSSQVAQFEQAYFNTTEQQEYDLLIADIAGDITALQTASAALSEMQKMPIGSTLNGDQKTALLNIRTQMPAVISHLNQVLNPSTPGANGAVQVWATISFRHQPFFAPTATLQNAIYASDYTTPAFNNIDYYEGLLVQALNLMSEAYHVSFMYQGESYPRDSGMVQCYTGWAQIFAKGWKKIPAQGLGRLTPDVLADMRNHRMWSRTWIAVPRTPPMNVACWTKDCGGPDITGYRVTQPDLRAYIAALNLGNHTDWRLPTNDEWDGLLTGIRSSNDPLGWLAAQGVQGNLIERGQLVYPLWSTLANGTPQHLVMIIPSTDTYSFDYPKCLTFIQPDGLCTAVPFVVRTIQ